MTTINKNENTPRGSTLNYFIPGKSWFGYFIMPGISPVQFCCWHWMEAGLKLPVAQDLMLQRAMEKQLPHQLLWWTSQSCPLGYSWSMRKINSTRGKSPIGPQSLFCENRKAVGNVAQDKLKFVPADKFGHASSGEWNNASFCLLLRTLYIQHLKYIVFAGNKGIRPKGLHEHFTYSCFVLFS